MFSRLRSFSRRHPRLTYLLYLGVIVVVLLEVGLRFVVRWDPGYYTAFRNPTPGAVLEFPYGEMRYNSLGFSDDEFDEVKTRPRVGYLGDSVCAGVGAGYGYRISELLEAELPEYEHLNLTGGLGSGIDRSLVEKYVEAAERFDLDVAIYLMNLNDIGPEEKDRRNRRMKVFDWLRGRSYIYTCTRRVVKNLLLRYGYTAGGLAQYELWPRKYEEVFKETTARVDAIGQRLAERGTALIVVLLPYEMQVSADAARTYTDAGIEWEEGFLDRSAQDVIRRHLDLATVVDGYDAFVDPADPARNRDAWQVGECFVYNRGDRLDWNHPNRQGHRLIAEHLVRLGVVPEAVESRRE